MAAITFVSNLSEDGSFTIPPEAVKTLGLRPGDEIQVRIESASEASAAQAELQRRGACLFEEADRTVREPGAALADPLEAAWAEGVLEKARRMRFRSVLEAIDWKRRLADVFLRTLTR